MPSVSLRLGKTCHLAVTVLGVHATTGPGPVRGAENWAILVPTLTELNVLSGRWTVNSTLWNIFREQKK